jgi:hypothetical protein
MKQSENTYNSYVASSWSGIIVYCAVTLPCCGLPA